MSVNTRVTVKVSAKNKGAFLDWAKKFGISKDRFLSAQLKEELDYLRQLPENSPKGKKLSRTLLSNMDAQRLNITLPLALAEDISQVCGKIGVSRDAFVDTFIDFLVNGDQDFGSCVSPLVKIEAMLDNPRFEYCAVENANPYDSLIWTDESVDEFVGLFGKTESRNLKRSFDAS